MLSHGQTTIFNFLLNTFRVLIFLILIIYLSKKYNSLNHLVVIVINYCFKKTPRQLRPKRGSPQSIIDSFFSTGDPAKDMLTFKNTLHNAQIRALAPDEELKLREATAAAAAAAAKAT
jgi:hypothetical protein